MSPEANKPETQKGSDLFIEGMHPTDRVRPFKQGDLEDVHEGLTERGVPEASTIDPETLEVDVDKIPIQTVEDTPKKWKKWVAGLIGTAVVAGGGYALSSDGEAKPETTRPTATAPVNPVETPSAPEQSVNTEATGEALISGLNKKATIEQVEYVIANPVNISLYPTAGEAIAALGDRWNVIANSGEVDYDQSTADTIVFTADDQANLELMSGSVLDASSPNYSANLESIRSRRGQIAAMFDSAADAETEVNFVPVTNAEKPLEANGTVELGVTTVWTTNRPDTQTSNGKYNNDYSSDMTLRVDAAGNVHISSSNNVTEIGNIG